MEGRERIKEIFGEFVEILENNRSEQLGKLLCADAELCSTNYGNAVGREAVVAALRWQGLPFNYSRSRIFNFVAFTDGTVGVQSAVVTTMVAQDDPDYVHYFHFGGYFLNDYVFEDGDWRIKRIRFNLDMEDGNTLFVRGWWKLIDYRLFEGAKDYPIVSEFDAPWRAVKHKDSLGSEEEQVLDSMYRYAWGIDHADTDVLISCLDENVRMGGPMPAPSGPAPQGSPRDVMVSFMNYKRFKEPIMEHIYKVVSVDIDGDRAVLNVYRYEPHRMGTKKLSKLNFDADFFTLKGEYEFRKLPGDWPQGGWKMTLNTVKEMKVFQAEAHNESRFY